MKLYSADLSPYGSRVRIAVYAKSLPVEILPPPGDGLKSPEYLAINPIGKIPALVLDDGVVIPESDTIVEYLADAFPAAGLRPSSPELIARGRLLARITELYVMAAGGALFGQLDPKTRNAEAVEAAFAALNKGLEHLNVFMTEDAYAVGDSLTTADCALAPILFFAGVFGQMFDRPSPLTGHGKVEAYWARIQKDPAVAKVLGEMRAALAARFGG